MKVETDTQIMENNGDTEPAFIASGKLPHPSDTHEDYEITCEGFCHEDERDTPS